jgi:hypothetical protein
LKYKMEVDGHLKKKGATVTAATTATTAAAEI